MTKRDNEKELSEKASRAIKSWKESRPDLQKRKREIEEAREIEFDLIVELLGIDKQEFANILGVDETTLASEECSPEKRALLDPYARILLILLGHFKDDTSRVTKWLEEPQQSWIYISPIEMIRRRKVDKVLGLLVSQLDPQSDQFNG